MMRVHEEGFRFSCPPILLGILLFLLGYPATAIIAMAIGIAILFFFREPDRKSPDDNSLLLSPADGRVLNIFNQNGLTTVAIFLSLVNVHINWAPCSGKIISTDYHTGAFLPAFAPKASELNEKNIIQMDWNGSQITIVQIAGLIARRILCWVKAGDSIRTGKIIGLIRFGSQVDITFPSSMRVLVKKGDRVKGSLTPIACLPLEMHIQAERGNIVC